MLVESPTDSAIVTGEIVIKGKARMPAQISAATLKIDGEKLGRVSLSSFDEFQCAECG